MRDFLNKSLAVLIWIATGFNVALSCYTGAMIIRYSPMQLMGDSTVILYGFLFILFGGDAVSGLRRHLLPDHGHPHLHQACRAEPAPSVTAG